MKKYFIILILFITNTLLAQVQFEAKVSKNSLGLNEKLRIDFTMNADGDNFSPPNFEASGFRVVGGPSQSISQSWINGKSSFNKSYTYNMQHQYSLTLNYNCRLYYRNVSNDHIGRRCRTGISRQLRSILGGLVWY